MSDQRRETVAAFLGVGRMGRALIARFLEADVLRANEILGTHHCGATAEELQRRLGVEMMRSNARAVERSSIVFICVRPQQYRGLLEEIGQLISGDQMVVSIGVGVPLFFLREAIGRCPNIVHLHPTSLVMARGPGISFMAHEDEASVAATTLVEKYLWALGRTVVVPESMIDRYAVFAGCAPGFFARIASRWSFLAEESGIPSELVQDIAAAILLGLGRGVSAGLAPEAIVRLIATPQGVTELGLKIIEAHGLVEVLGEVADDCLSTVQKIRSTFG